jgi:hypothetical protein
MNVGLLRQNYLLHITQAEQNFITECFGDYLEESGAVPAGLLGREAIEHYLINKHHWLPAQVRSLSWEDLRACLHAEIAGWTLPAEARAAMQR